MECPYQYSKIYFIWHWMTQKYQLTGKNDKEPHYITLVLNCSTGPCSENSTSSCISPVILSGGQIVALFHLSVVQYSTR